MLVNPGGPGGSGLGLSILGEYVPNGVGDAYDWIGFDPRGVGASKPSLTCDVELPRLRPSALRAEAPSSWRRTWLKPRPRPTPRRARRPAAAARPPEDPRLGQGHGEHPQGARRRADQLLRLLVRHLPRPGLRTAAPDPGAPHGARRQRRPAPGLVQGEPRPGRRVRPQHQDLLRLGRQVRQRLPPRQDRRRTSRRSTTRAAQAARASTPPAESSAPTSGPTSSSPAGYYVYGWDELAEAFSGWVNDGDCAAAQGPCTTTAPDGRATTTGTPIYLGVQCTDVQWPKNVEHLAEGQRRIYTKAHRS